MWYKMSKIQLSIIIKLNLLKENIMAHVKDRKKFKIVHLAF
jgi:hypothetical protein